LKNDKGENMSNKPLMILIAGPYRSGTNDDPEKIQANVHFMESFALPIFRKGHIPVLGEWFALPLVSLAGSKQIGDEAFNEIFHPIAELLLEKCDAVLRVGGASSGADLMVKTAQSLGLQAFYSIDEIPAR
jgi:hypothetical protein